MSEVIFSLLFLSFLLEITCIGMEDLQVLYGLEKDLSSNVAALRRSQLPVVCKAACNQGAISFCNDLERINNEYIAGIIKGFKYSPGKRICVTFQFYSVWSWRQWSISVLGTRCSVTHWSGLHVWCADKNNPNHSHRHLWITNWAKAVFSDELLIYSKFRICVQLIHNLTDDTYCSEGYSENWEWSIWLSTHICSQSPTAPPGAVLCPIASPAVVLSLTGFLFPSLSPSLVVSIRSDFHQCSFSCITFVSTSSPHPFFGRNSGFAQLCSAHRDNLLGHMQFWKAWLNSLKEVRVAQLIEINSIQLIQMKLISELTLNFCFCRAGPHSCFSTVPASAALLW